MSEKRTAPKLRFKGFTDDWQKQKLENLVQRVTRKNKDLKSKLPLTISAQDGLISQTNFFSKQVASKRLENYLLLKKGDFAYNKSYSTGYPYGAIKRLNKYKYGVLSTLYIAFKPQKVNSDYLEQYFETTKWYKEIYKRATEGARNHGLLNISPTDFFNLKINIAPSNLEQEKISKLFLALSNIITLQQRKLDLLKKLKKGFLQKLFSNENSLNPEIRFNGFIDKWSQNQLSNYLITSKEINSKNLFNKYDILSVSGDYGVVNQIAFQGRSFAGKSLTKYRILNPGEIVYTKSPLKKSPYGIIKDNKFKQGIVSSLYAVYKIRKYVDANFIEYYFSSQLRLNKYLKPIVNIGAKHTVQVSDDGALKGKVQFPSFAEQRKIAQLLQKLDDQIHFQEKKYNQLNQIKKFLLQNMFI